MKRRQFHDQFERGPSTTIESQGLLACESNKMASRHALVAEMGVTSMVREAFRIFKNNARTLIAIQLAIGIPVTILSLAFDIIRSTLEPSMVEAQPGPAGSQVWFMENLKEIVYTNRVSLSQSLWILTAQVFIVQVADALQLSANMYVVGLVYTKNIVSFKEVLKTAVYRLWKRVLITMLYLQILVTSALFCCLGLIVLIIRFQLDSTWILIPALSLLGVTFYILVISMVASSVSVLEKDYGWAALRKSRQLVRGKIRLALRFQFLLFASIIPANIFETGNLARLQKNPWNPLHYLMIIAYIVWVTFTSQIIELFTGVAYASFKAHHGESIACSHLFDDEWNDGTSELEEGLVEFPALVSTEK